MCALSSFGDRKISTQLQRLNAREQQAERKRDTRRKILLGARVLDRTARGELAEAEVKADMDRFLERAQDRALFDLPPRA